MLRFVRRFIRETIEIYFSTVQARQDDLEIIVRQIDGKLDWVSGALAELAESHEKEKEQHRADAVGTQPLQQSRPTWARMKRQLEERDIREMLASQRQEPRLPHLSTANEEADKVAAYWEAKAKGKG